MQDAGAALTAVKNPVRIETEVSARAYEEIMRIRLLTAGGTFGDGLDEVMAIYREAKKRERAEARAHRKGVVFYRDGRIEV